MSKKHPKKIVTINKPKLIGLLLGLIIGVVTVVLFVIKIK